ncbi:MAG: glycosyltransferase family 4 protein [Gammaproteobacteria bacterium]|nr:glycosyltransferase family 4 protein [Gammaproteobacteria bacterium]
MRIGLLIYGDINTISGGYLYDRKLVEYLRKNGDEVTVISLKKPSYFKALLTYSIPDVLKSIKLDVLIQDELVHPSFWLINKQLKKLLKCPIVSLVHLFNSARPVGPYKKMVYKLIENFYLNSVDALILNSKETLNQSNKLLDNKLLPNIIAFPCGDNFTAVEKINRNYIGQNLKILFVGNITQQKGLHVLIKAIHMLDESITLSVVGREDIDLRYMNNIKKYIAINGIENRIKFYGSLTDESLKKQYLDNDVFVLPSINEAYGIVFLEAMQFGLPVIGCNLGGAQEIIEDGVNGYLVDSKDEQGLAEFITLLDNDRELLKKMSELVQKKYSQHPTWDESSKKIRTFLMSLIQKKETTFGQ